MKILVCGDRKYINKDYMRSIILQSKPAMVIEGGAAGADTLAKEIAQEAGVEYKEYPAQWNKHGKNAGPIRNQIMLNDNPDIEIVYAFHDHISESRGTKDMVARAQKAHKIVILNGINITMEPTTEHSAL